jgi:hypothetical protein
MHCAWLKAAWRLLYAVWVKKPRKTWFLSTKGIFVMAKKSKGKAKPKGKRKSKAKPKGVKRRSGPAGTGAVVSFKPKAIPVEPIAAELPPEHKDTQREGYAAWQRIRTGGHYADHCKVRDLLKVYVDMAMGVSGANSKQSPLYKKAFRSLLAQTELAALLDKKNESYRVRLLQLTPEVDAWHAALPEHEKREWNSPKTVLENYKKHFGAAAGVPNKREAAKAAKKAKADEKARVEANNAQVNADAIARAEAAEAELANLKANATTEANATTDPFPPPNTPEGVVWLKRTHFKGLFDDLLVRWGHDPNVVRGIVDYAVEWLCGKDRNMVRGVIERATEALRKQKAPTAQKKK